MSHVRTQLVEEVADVLDGLTTTGSNVFVGQVYAVGVDQMPCLCVFTNSEEVELVDRSTQKRAISLVVEGRVRAETGADEILDDIAAEVETALLADQFLDGLTQGIDLVSTEKEFSADAEGETGSVSMTFTVHILTAPGAPGTAL